MYRGRGAGGEGPVSKVCALNPGSCPAHVVNGGTEGRAGQDYVSSEFALPCAKSGVDVPPGGTSAKACVAVGGPFVGGKIIENSVAWQPWHKGTGRPRLSALHAVYWRCALFVVLYRALCLLILCTVCYALPHTVCCVPSTVRCALCGPCV